MARTTSRPEPQAQSQSSDTHYLQSADASAFRPSGYSQLRPAVMAGAPLHDKVLPLLTATLHTSAELMKPRRRFSRKSDTGCDLEETETPAGAGVSEVQSLRNKRDQRGQASM